MLFLLSALAFAATVIATTPNVSEVSIGNIVYGGTGCPQGSLSSFISADRQTFTLIFDDYVASIGPGVSIIDSRMNCQLNIDLNYPSGFQYSIFSQVYRGYVELDAGVSATQEATYYFSGQTAETSTSANWNGPINGDYEVIEDITLTSVIWSPCGAPVPLNIDSQVRLETSSSTASGQITDDSQDGKITFVVGVQWQEC